MQKNVIVVGVVALIIGLAGGYFGRQFLSPRRMGSNVRNLAGNSSPFRQTVNGQRNSFGQIQAIQSDRLTLKARDGSTQIILLTGDTVYEKSSPASQTDFQNGTAVQVSGKANPDGSITAASVQTAPANFGQGGLQNPVNPNANNF